MANQIDERIVSMKFDNAQFEKNTRETLKSLRALSDATEHLDGVKGLKGLADASKQVDLKRIEQEASSLQVKFSAMSVVAITALQRMTNATIDAGKRMTKALTIEPITTGFNEYELKMGSIQTIMASTGASIQEVNGYLNELNEYSDKTIYSFSDMTNNIGKFTNAGVSLDKAVLAIKGVSNAAAVSGATANEASRAMYNFAQALSAGYVKLIDWKSIEFANMATVEFKNQLIQTGLELGTVKDAGEGMYKTLSGHLFNATNNFNEVLADQWMSTDVLVDTLSKYASETTAIGKKAYAAAQDVKTFTMMLDTLKEAAQSGWAMTYEYIFGDFEEAKELWSAVNAEVSKVIENSANERNEMLREWKELGGRDTAIQAIASAWQTALSFVEPVRDAIRDMFPPITGRRLFEITEAFKSFVESLKLSEASAYTLRVAVKTLLLPVKAVTTALSLGIKLAAYGIKMVWGLADALISLPSRLNNFSTSAVGLNGPLTGLAELMVAAKGAVVNIAEAFVYFYKQSKALFKMYKGPSTRSFTKFFKEILSIFKEIASFANDKLIGAFRKVANFDYKNSFSRLKISFLELKDTIKSTIEKVENFFSSFEFNWRPTNLERVSSSLGQVRDDFSTMGFSEFFTAIKEGAISIPDILLAIGDAAWEMCKQLTPAKILIFGFGAAIVTFTFSLTNAVDSARTAIGTFTKMFTGFNDIIGNIKKATDKRWTQLATAITILAGALFIISMVDPNRVVGATVATVGLMGAMTGMVALLAVINKFLGGKGFNKALKQYTTAMLALSGSVLALSIACTILSKIDFTGAITAIGMTAGLMTILIIASNKVATASPKMVANAAVLLTFGVAIASVVKSLEKIANADLAGISKNIGNLILIVGLISVLSLAGQKVSFGGAAGLILLTLDILLFLKTLKKVADYDIDTMIIGILKLVPLILAMGVLARVCAVTKKGEKSVVSMVGMSTSVLMLCIVVAKIGELPLATVAKGVLAVTTLLGAFAVVAAVMLSSSKEGVKAAKLGSQFIAMALSIAALSLAVKYLGGLDVNTVVKGTAVVMALLGMFAVVFKAGSIGKGATASIVAMTAAVVALTSMVLVMSLDPTIFKEAVKASALIVGLALGLSLAIKAISNVGGILKTAIPTIILMTTVITLLTAVLLKVKNIGSTQDAIAILTGVSLIMVIVSKIVGQMKPLNFKEYIDNVIIMAAFLAAIGVSMWTLNGIHTDGLYEKAISLSLIVLALSFVAKALSQLTVLTDLTALAATVASLIILFGSVAGLMAVFDGMIDPNGLIEKTAGLSLVLIALAASVVIMNKIKGTIGTAITAGVSLIVLISTMGIVLGVFYALLDSGDLDQGRLDLACEMLLKIGAAIGGFFGNLVGGFVGGLATAGLITAAQNMVAFMDTMKDFFDSVKMVDSDTVSNTQSLVTAVNELSKLSFKDDDSLTRLGENLEAFAPHVKSYYDQLSSVKGVYAAGMATDGLAKLIAAIPEKASLKSLIFGGTADMESFGASLRAIGSGMKNYIESINGVTFNQVQVNASVTAASSILTLTDNMGRSGGLLQKFLGTKNLGVFGSQLAALGNGIVSYWNSISGVEPAINFNKIETSADAISVVSDMANDLPLTGGELQTIIGGKDLSHFATTLEDLARGIVNYWTIFSPISASFDKKKIKDSGEALLSITEVLNDLPNSGGTWQEWFGQADMSSFSKDLTELGAAFVSFFDQVETVKNRTFLTAMLTALDNFSSRVDGYTQKFKDNAGKIVDAFIEGLTPVQNKARVVGGYAAEGFISGVNAKKLRVKAQMKLFGEEAIAATMEALDENSPSRKFMQIGSYAVDGFTIGVRDNTRSATSGMVKMGEKILNSIRTFFGIHSPSVLMRDEVGRYIVQGIAEGITSDMSAEEAASKKAENIANIFKSRLSNIQIDLQTIDIEDQLWATLNPNAKASEISDRAKNKLDRQLKLVGEQVEIKNATYLATLKALGADAEKTKEARNDYMQAQLDFAEYAQQLLDMQGTQASNTTDAMVAYAQYMAESKDDLLKAGFTLEQIQSAAAEKTGWGLTSATNELNKQFTTIQDVMAHYIENVDVVIRDTTASKVSSGFKTGMQMAGQDVVSYVPQGVNNVIDKVSEAVQGGDGNKIVGALREKFAGSGTAIWEGIVDGASSGLDKVKEAGSNLFNKANEGLKETGEIHSPSQVMYENGIFVVDGFVNGINDNAWKVKEALDNLTHNWLTGYNTDRTGVVGQFNQTVENTESDTSSNVDNFIGNVLQQINSYQDDFYSAGQLLSKKLAEGMSSNIQSYFQQVIDAVSAQLTALEKVVDEKVNNIIAEVNKALEAASKITASVGVVAQATVDQRSSSGGGGGGVPNRVTKVTYASPGETLEGLASLKKQSLTTSKALASKVASTGTVVSGKSSGGTTNVYNNFTQNNNSPKALNASTIYRKTNNAFQKFVKNTSSNTGKVKA